jgi:adenylate kinase family enzyme
MKLNRLYIIGARGSGKTTLANRLSKILKIKTYDLDNLVMKKNSFEKVSEKLRDRLLKNLIAKNRWIIEGAYSRDWISPIYKRAELIIIISRHPWITKKRIIVRSLKRRFGFDKTRRKESINDFMALMSYQNRYPKEDLTKHFRLVKKHKKNFLVLKNMKQINKFVESIR